MKKMPTLRSIKHEEVPIQLADAADDSASSTEENSHSPAITKRRNQDENEKLSSAQSKSSLFSLSPGSRKKNATKKPRVTESLSPGSPLRESQSSNQSTPTKRFQGKRLYPFTDADNDHTITSEGDVAHEAKRKKNSPAPLFCYESDSSEGSLSSTLSEPRKIDYSSLDDGIVANDVDAKKPKAHRIKAGKVLGASHPTNESVSLENEWITSHHASFQDESINEYSSDSSDDDYQGDTKDWLTSSKRRKKLEDLGKIVNVHDKALQLLLWDIGFDYSIHAHQFEAIRFVAGFIPTFPFDQDGNDSKEMLELNQNGRYCRKKALDQKNLRRPGRGMILADEMGLGKTIEALAGAALRNYCTSRLARKKLPTLIVTPQDGVQQQWLQSLVNGGVEQARISIMGEKKCDRNDRIGKNKQKRQTGDFIICTRYKIQSEMKKLFEYNATRTIKSKSLLFDMVPPIVIKQLRQEYLIEQGKERAPRQNKKEKKQDRVANIVARIQLKKVFETVIIDEAHFLRNVLAYWGLGAAALGAQSKRTILLSGTPFNNSNSDMSALMTFIDPRHEAARVKWWDKATSGRSATAIIRDVGEWKKIFMLRRQKDVLGDKLPSRHRCVIDAPLRLSEFGVYEYYEYVFLKVLDQLKEDEDNRRKQREMVNIMMSCMACMRAALIHPVLPRGREVTLQFSPSRKHLLKREEQNKVCVLCSILTPTENAEKHKAIKEGEEENEKLDFRKILGSSGSRTDENIFEGDDEPSWDVDDSNRGNDEKGRIVEITATSSVRCHAAGSDCCHWAHERCLELFEEKGYDKCPRCLDFSSRLHFSSTDNNKIYCQDIKTSISETGGFTASAKIEKAVEWFRSVPKSEKALILSFFKGSLDLLEGILTYEHGIKCCRYDGDVPKEERSRDLDDFKTNDECRLLLASVQSGGTGLNIVEGNNVLFLDRWYNPQIHDQAESRCHRLGQTKGVKIGYLDTSYTADVVMRHVNTLKEGNAGVILADGTSLGHTATINYADLAGVLGETLKATIAMRAAAFRLNVDNGDESAPLLFEDDFDLEQKLSDTIAALKANKKTSTKKIKSDEEICSSQDEPVNMNNPVHFVKAEKKAYNGGLNISDEDSGDELLRCKPMFPASKKEDTPSIADAKMPSAKLDLGASAYRYDSSDEGSGDELLRYKPMFPVSKKEDTQTTSAKLVVSTSGTFPNESKKTAVEVMPLSFNVDTTTSSCNAPAKSAIKSEPAALVTNTSDGDSSNPINLCLSDEEDEEQVLEEKLRQATSAEDWASYEMLYKQLEHFRGL